MFLFRILTIIEILKWHKSMRKKLKTKKVMRIIYLKNRKIYVRGLKMQVLCKTVVYSKRIMRAPVMPVRALSPSHLNLILSCI